MNELITKICTKCKKDFPATKEYFCSSKSGKYGVESICKSCKSIKNKKRNNEIKNKIKVKPDKKICLKCNRELLYDKCFFPVDNTSTTGLRNVCRECIGRSFLEEGYQRSRIWTDEENKVFINIYPFYTNNELINLFYPNETLKSLHDRAYRFNIKKTKDTIIKAHKEQGIKVSLKLKNRVFSEETKLKISLSRKGKYVGKNNYWYGRKRSEEQKKNISKRMKGNWSGNANPRHLNPLNGELNGRWRGGIKQLYFDLRDHIQEWKRNSMEECNYKCVLTNSKFDNIHHLYNFKNIVDELFKELDYPMYKTIGEYSEEERNQIYKLLNEKHKFYGYGRCVCKPLHKLFHDIYNYTNNTKEQWDEFEKRYFNFEFDDLLEDKYKYKNIINKN